MCHDAGLGIGLPGISSYLGSGMDTNSIRRLGSLGGEVIWIGMLTGMGDIYIFILGWDEGGTSVSSDVFLLLGVSGMVRRQWT